MNGENNRDFKVHVTQDQINDAINKIKKQEMVNRLFGYTYTDKQMQDKIVKIVDDIVR